MAKIFTILFMFFFGLFLYGQKFISGQIISESNRPIPNVEVINISNDSRTTTDSNGRFLIKATDENELRIVKEGYDRIDYRLNYLDFGKDFVLTLSPKPIDIELVNVGLAMTGNLKKDVKKVTNVKVQNLNQEIASFLRYGKQTELVPKPTVPKDFQPASVPNVGFDLIKTAGFISRLIKGKPEKPVFYATNLQTQQFYKNLKNDLGEDYFLSFGLNDVGADDFLMFCEGKRHLASKYFKDYNVGLIKVELEELYVQYQNKKKGSLIDVINHKDMAKLTALNLVLV